MLSFSQLLPLFNKIIQNFYISDEIEISIEANPATITQDIAQSWKTLGINRVSVGAQSFNENELKVLGRLHSAEEIEHAVDLVKTHCTDNISLDLMYGIPQQTFSSWQHSLRSALKLTPTHISSYCLSIEQDTPLFDSQLEYHFPSENHQKGMYYMMKSMLEKNGYVHYEISNFALPNKRSLHNDKYWRGKEYIGIGAAAHSFINMTRSENVDDVDRYITNIQNSKSIIRKKKKIPHREYISDCIFLGLRRLEGIDLSAFKERHDFDILHKYGDVLETYISSGYLTVQNDHLKLTRKALFVSDEILSEFV